MSYNSLTNYYKNKYHSKVIKISLNGGFTCPNRINGNNGCIFCSGNDEFAGQKHDSLAKQFATIKKTYEQKWPHAKYIAYFSSYTNTFDTLPNLKLKYETALKLPVIGLSIATRSDAISDEVLNYLNILNTKTDLTIELGLQSMHDETLKLINRGHDLKNFDNMVKRLKSLNIKVVVHIINGLPNETEKMMLETIHHLNSLNIDGIKIHMLYINKNTPLELIYQNNPFKLLTEEEYIDIVCKQLEILNPNTIIHRLTGDGRKEDVIAPLWTLNKKSVLNGITKKLKSNNSYQGKFYQK